MEGRKVEIPSTKRHVKFSIIHSSGNYHLFPSFLSLLKSLLRLNCSVIWISTKKGRQDRPKEVRCPYPKLMRPFSGDVTVAPPCSFNRKMVSMQWVKKWYHYLGGGGKKSCLLNRTGFECLTAPSVLDWPQICLFNSLIRCLLKLWDG